MYELKFKRIGPKKSIKSRYGAGRERYIGCLSSLILRARVVGELCAPRPAYFHCPFGQIIHHPVSSPSRKCAVKRKCAVRLALRSTSKLRYAAAAGRCACGMGGLGFTLTFLLAFSTSGVRCPSSVVKHQASRKVWKNGASSSNRPPPQQSKPLNLTHRVNNPVSAYCSPLDAISLPV